MDGFLLEVEGLRVEAGAVPLLHGFSMTLKPGERVAIRGPSGCGKSTLLRTLARLQDPVEGMMRLAGEEVQDGDMAARMPVYRRQVIYVQQVPFVRAGSVEENLRLPFSYTHARGMEFPRDMARAWLEELGVGAERLDQPARSLSLGQRQRVCLIRAALLDPGVWLLDEPTSALDPESVEGVEAWLRARTEAGNRAMVVVSHDTAQVGRLCTREIDLRPWLCRKPGDGAASGERGEAGGADAASEGKGEACMRSR